ncbi:uncharacterized protein METZ01_LOCUS327864, partial [marine metagenome]
MHRLLCQVLEIGSFVGFLSKQLFLSYV